MAERPTALPEREVSRGRRSAGSQPLRPEQKHEGPNEHVPTTTGAQGDDPQARRGQRQLGIPTVLDRLIQQALLQVLQPLIDPSFSNHSHGFRPGRRAHDAVKAARADVQSGKRVVVDVDLAKFFDRVNHDILIDRRQRRIEDAGVIGLVRAYLNAGIMEGGVASKRHLGTPQGGPLSPLLANVLLDEVDKVLEARGYSFARYADDCNVHVGSTKAGERGWHCSKNSTTG